MILYHTSTIEIVKPDLLHSRPRLDFGIGFYLTFMRSQSERYGERYKRQGEDAIMNVYEFNEIRPNCSYKLFDAYDGDWLDFVALCRKGLPHQAFDVIEGGIADDNVFDTVDLYFAGVYTREQALDQLIHKKPNHQICITSQAVLDKHLRFVESIKL
jgi:hypothetical protein